MKYVTLYGRITDVETGEILFEKHFKGVLYASRLQGFEELHKRVFSLVSSGRSVSVSFDVILPDFIRLLTQQKICF